MWAVLKSPSMFFGTTAVDRLIRYCFGVREGMDACIHEGAYIYLLTHTPKSSVLERYNWPWFGGLVGLGNGVSYLRRETTVSPSMWQTSLDFNINALQSHISLSTALKWQMISMTVIRALNLNLSCMQIFGAQICRRRIWQKTGYTLKNTLHVT